MKNNLEGLNDLLFKQLENLSNTDIKGAELKEEIVRATAVTNVAKEIINNGHLMMMATKFQMETLGRSVTTMPKLLGE